MDSVYALIVCPLPFAGTVRERAASHRGAGARYDLPLDPVRGTGKPDLVVAVDGGADRCAEQGWPVDVAIGDMDSVSMAGVAHIEQCGAEQVLLPIDKDLSDLDVAVQWCNDRTGADRVSSVVVLGAIGGRLDHQIAALGAMGRLDAETVVAFGPQEDVYVLTEGCAADVEPLATFSIMSLDETARVSVEGARWPLNHAMVGPGSSLGLSNRALGGGARVTAEAGKIAVLVLR